MAEIAPFCAYRYNPSQVSLSSVVTQPYDKITAAMQSRYYDASPYNLVRIILGKKLPGDTPTENIYTRAAKDFSQWRSRGILQQDRDPAIYPYLQRFSVPGTAKEVERRGFIAVGRIEDYSAGVVHRHEQTLAKPKADRLDLLRATRAHFGQIFMLYSDPAGEIDRLLTNPAAPEMETTDDYQVVHQVWKISNPQLVDSLRSRMRDKKLIIADGHHRYETALAYRDERRAGAGSRDPSAPYEFVMMTFVNMDGPGLVILPTHRVVHGLSNFSSDELRDKAREYFRVEEIDPELDSNRAAARLREAGQVGTALLAVTRNRAFLLDHPQPGHTEVFNGLSDRQRALDVVQLHRCLLEAVLGLSQASIRDQQNLSYVRDTGEAIGLVRRGGANVAFLMNPARVEQVRDIAFAGEVLPQKSTDFYPKLLSGLAIYALE
ncbi:MAG TPA: DUF1015 domain-containing protein [Terriglobales bacterium]